jgi:hypothetical protein
MVMLHSVRVFAAAPEIQIPALRLSNWLTDIGQKYFLLGWTDST